MNKPHFLQKLAPLGVATLSTITIIGIVPTRAEAATAYAYSEASFDIGFTANGFDITTFGTETSTSAEILLPPLLDGHVDPIDANQACVGTAATDGMTGRGVGDCVLPANDFLGFFPNTDGPLGQNNPDYARSDVVINSVSTGGIDAINAAEIFVDDVIGTQTEGEADGEWEYGTNLFTTELGDSLTIDIEGYYELVVEVTGAEPGEAFAEAEYELGLFLNGTNLLDFAPDGFNFSSAISRIETARASDSDFIDTSFTVNFGDANGNGIIDGNEIETGTYNITAEAIEAVAANVASVPEPKTIFGFLGVASLALGLKRKKKL